MSHIPMNIISNIYLRTKNFSLLYRNFKNNETKQSYCYVFQFTVLPFYAIVTNTSETKDGNTIIV